MLFKQSDMIINATINEELALGELKEHLPKKENCSFRHWNFFISIFWFEYMSIQCLFVLGVFEYSIFEIGVF